MKKLCFCIFLQSTHQVDMKNIVEFQKEFFAYFNTLETYSAGFIFQIWKSFCTHLNSTLKRFWSQTSFRMDLELGGQKICHNILNTQVIKMIDFQYQSLLYKKFKKQQTVCNRRFLTPPLYRDNIVYGWLLSRDLKFRHPPYSLHIYWEK